MATLPKRDYWLTRFIFQRALGFIYLLGFLIIIHQYVPLLGANGLYPISLFLKRIEFWQAPSLFWWNHADSFLQMMGWVGLVLAVLAMLGISEQFGHWISSAIWFLLWVIYLSFVNVGQTFYGFGWESILLETGFLAIFLGSAKTKPPVVVIWMLRWVLFRVMFGAGLIKIRGDACWLDLTCMLYHYETQPIPNPLSAFFHRFPVWIHKGEILFTHFVELIVPWGYFLIRPLCLWAGLLTIVFQFILILSGNLSWLNYMTIVLCIPCLDDRFFGKPLSSLRKQGSSDGDSSLRWNDIRMSLGRKFLLGCLTVFICVLSINPTMNMLSSRQRMNASFDPLHLVNTYGAFGSVTRERHEVIILGTEDVKVTDNTLWKEYEFKCKPGDPKRKPCLMSPYHYRLDWQIWFAAMNSWRYHPWILNFTAKLLKGDKPVLSLIEKNPFEALPPKWIKADLYHYRFATLQERKQTGQWWIRRYVRSYFPPVSLESRSFQDILEAQGWL